MITTAEILALHVHGKITRDTDLVRVTSAALGAKGPLTAEEHDRSVQGCADQLEMLRLMGVALLAEPPAPKWEPGLTARATAALVAMRLRSLTPLELRHSLGDEKLGDTERLVVDMARRDAFRGAALIVRAHGRWHLTDEAVAWLEGPEGGGLTVAIGARLSYVQEGR